MSSIVPPVSSGNRRSTVPLSRWPVGPKRLTGKPVIAVGSVGLDNDFVAGLIERKAGSNSGLDRLIQMIDEGEADLVAIGRALLVDPAWAAKIREGRTGELRALHAGSDQDAVPVDSLWFTTGRSAVAAEDQASKQGDVDLNKTTRGETMSIRMLAGGSLLLAISAAAAITVYTQQPPSTPAAHAPVTKAQGERWNTELSNWGRWGKEDQLGALNLVTPQKRQQAMALAKSGTVVSLERPVALSPAPEATRADGKPHGISFYEIRFKTFPPDDPQGNPGFSSDIQEFHVHGGMTHLDALCHDSDGHGKLYNGFPLADTVSETVGCRKLGLDNLKEGIVTRGVLIDMTRLKGARAPGASAYTEDIEAWERQTGLKVSPGDALFVYNSAPTAGRNVGGGGGFDLSVLPWFKTRGVAVTSNVRAIADDRHANHRIVLSSMGVYLLDGVVLDQLAETAARLARWEFMLVVAPLRIPGAPAPP